jgi:hypothetical protein
MAAFQVVDKILERNPRAAEAGHAAHDLRVPHDYGVIHCFTLSQTGDSVPERNRLASKAATNRLMRTDARKAVFGGLPVDEPGPESFRVSQRMK